jgi:hypothetical protein
MASSCIPASIRLDLEMMKAAAAAELLASMYPSVFPVTKRWRRLGSSASPTTPTAPTSSRRSPSSATPRSSSGPRHARGCARRRDAPPRHRRPAAAVQPPQRRPLRGPAPTAAAVAPFRGDVAWRRRRGSWVTRGERIRRNTERWRQARFFRYGCGSCWTGLQCGFLPNIPMRDAIRHLETTLYW